MIRDPLEPLQMGLHLQTLRDSAFRRRTFEVMVTRTDRRRKAWLDEVRIPAREVFLPDSACSLLQTL
ncbi:hypothetical protein [Methanoculleus oceani]|uniref:Sulfotransferase family protein n=1 Tax=Methanoculleus oceani TaxID=2184756 RepID=A0ABD4TGZ1_9EURY|nr:hypothetical protein [Methanoculleus sp. CWC-02]MCM2466852.1 hypothetical protein [Methanoculleus sp. CWC-02]